MFLCVDVQLVLSWILPKNKKNKNVFVGNRVTDISKCRTEIQDQYGLEYNFKYVPSDQNPAKLITRGRSNGEFERQLIFWSYGPSFISDNQTIWRSSNLGCLSNKNKLLAWPTLEVAQKVLTFSVDWYSDPEKLSNVTSSVFMFQGKCKLRSEIDDQYMSDTKTSLNKNRTKLVFCRRNNFSVQP